MKISHLLGAGLVACAAAPAAADTICEWMEFEQAIEAAAAPPQGAPRTPDHDHAETQVALAMFEAVNAIDRRYESYVGMPIGDAHASQQAAAITAAYKVMSFHYPSQAKSLDDSYALALQQVPESKAKADGKTIGEQAAAAALKVGQIDPSVAQTPYSPSASPGVWVPTQLPVFEPFSVAFKPWILPSAAAVRPAPPPALDSTTWVRDYDEVRRLGGRISKDRTPTQTLMARYRITPDMNPSMRLAADAPGRSMVSNARMFALMNMITDDAGMAMADAKLHYNFWRPITAIRNGDKDSSAATEADRSWEPLISTPNHPEYPCGHCTYAGAIAEFMSAEVGPKPAYGVRVASRSLPNAAVQALPSWDAWAREVSFSRTLGGVHYRFSNEAGEKLGRDVAKLGLANIMRPLPKGKARPAIE
ncbi:vanadium-dependent haloperoxidase [Sphingomonas piscis]|uniref:Vanadium-dependent haloperoxidase n=1 Tax=Sphingomonas piscis TaxID=2714943 RepID=A0A6G7YLU2_9SPHN|nr:vanadium-dependent haloperoxidase [Sphingomonas piscis]QIK77711.1 vanadium-dependent haloperoxidase [Sphingomonas piscis]